jgi:hypothetical protein
MAMPGYVRLRRLMMPDEMMGPDMQFAPMQMPPMQQNGTGQAVGQLAGVGLSRLAKLRAPDLKPDGSSPFDKLPTAKLDGGGGGFVSGFKKLFHFRQGGKLSDALKRPGDVAVVGEEEPEAVVKLPGGETEVVPFSRLKQSTGGASGFIDPRTYGQRPVPGVMYATGGAGEAARPREVYGGPYSKIRDLLGEASSEGKPVVETANEYRPAPPVEQPTQPVPVLPEFDETQSATRRRFADMPGRWQSQLEYEQANPAQAPEGRSKWQKIRDVFEQGLQGVNAARSINPDASVAEMLAAGTTSGAIQGVRPQTVYEGRQRQRMGVDAHNLEVAQAGEDANLKRAGLLSRINLETAQAVKARQRPTVNKQHVVIDNHAYVFDPAEGTYTDANLPGGKKYKLDHDELGPYFHTDDPADPIVRPKGAELRQFIEAPVSTGGTARVPATEIYRGDRATEAANATAQQQYGRESYGDSKEEVDKKYQNDLTLWQDAQKDVAEHRAKRAALLGVASQVTALEQSRATLHRQIEQLEAKGDDGEDDKRLAKLQDRLDKEDEKYGLLLEQNKAQLGELGAFEQSIQERNGQLVRKGADGFYSLASSRPTHPGYGRRQPPPTRGGSAAPKQITAQSTEAEVRAAALAHDPPKDPEAAVAKWRKLQQ